MGYVLQFGELEHERMRYYIFTVQALFCPIIFGLIHSFYFGLIQIIHWSLLLLPISPIIAIVIINSQAMVTDVIFVCVCFVCLFFTWKSSNSSELGVLMSL